jgi:hypothetical protein
MEVVFLVGDVCCSLDLCCGVSSDLLLFPTLWLAPKFIREFRTPRFCVHHSFRGPTQKSFSQETDWSSCGFDLGTLAPLTISSMLAKTLLNPGLYPS